MIIYQRRFFGLETFLRVFGSVVPYASIPASLSTALAIYLFFYQRDYVSSHTFANIYPHSIFTGFVSVLLVFRTNLSYTRFNDGSARLFQIFSSWSEAIALALTCEDCNSENEQSKIFSHTVIHQSSLLMSVALQTLSRKIVPKHLKKVDIRRAAKTFHTKQGSSFSITKYMMEESKSSERVTKKVQPMASFVNESNTIKRLNKQKPETSMFMPTLKELQIEKIDFALPEDQVILPLNELAEFVYILPVLGGISEIECALIGEHMDDEMGYVHEDPTYRVYTWLLKTITRRLKALGSNVPPSVATRIITQLSDGLGAYSQCLRLVEIPFPFPYAQLVSLILFIFMWTAPVMIVLCFHSLSMVVVFNFSMVLCYFSLNEVAGQLEQPFGYDHNDLPLPVVQQQFNQRITSLLDSDPFSIHIMKPNVSKPVMEGAVELSKHPKCDSSSVLPFIYNDDLIESPKLE